MINLSTLILCGAPNTVIPDIPTSACEHFGKVQRIIFQRCKNGATANTIPAGSGAGGAGVLATWQALTAATDGTKAQFSPFTESPAFTDGTVRTARGGNDSYGGVPISLGYEPTEFEAQILSARQDVIAALKLLRNEDAYNLGVYLISADGKLMANVDDVATPTTLSPIPIQQFNIGNKVAGGYDDVDYNALSFQLEDNWSNTVATIPATDFAFDLLTYA
ncbi:MAG TPA: hypothetical protein DCW83_12970 [Saprospirales bacterium]|nr:hypothetical protein [Saprospirales bacterium]